MKIALVTTPAEFEFVAVVAAEGEADRQELTRFLLFSPALFSACCFRTKGEGEVNWGLLVGTSGSCLTPAVSPLTEDKLLVSLSRLATGGWDLTTGWSVTGMETGGTAGDDKSAVGGICGSFEPLHTFITVFMAA